MWGVKDTILVGDVGGTNVRLGLADKGADGKLILTQFSKVRGDDVGSLDDAIDQFLAETHFKPRHVCMALAGPVANGEVSLTNREWHISETALSKRFGFDNVRLYNDFTAMARSVPELQANDFRSLHKGTQVPGKPVLVAGPGTGFGTSTIIQINGRWHVISGEGGHQAWAPQSEAETELLHILQKSHDFVSLELVSSGHGMDTVHSAICERHGLAYKKMRPADILTAAHSGDAVCREVCEVRGAAVMGALGDMAMIFGAQGGIVLAGGVSERLVDFIDTPKALSRFTNRGPMSDYVADIPVDLLLNSAAPLFGVAALYLDSMS
ncbi:ROK family protein [Fretibacter rubidus]|uniref:glucokinase n=1 Tax=Fretibacter rubidus TaxID=570162 RepID=UPI00352BAFC6